MQVHLLPVYSKLAQPDEIPPELEEKLPQDLRLSLHQVETYRALTQGDCDVVFNTAMTGDGKSLAGELPMLVQGGINWSTLAMYPTNELIADQLVCLENLLKLWTGDVIFSSVNSAELDRLIEDVAYQRRGEALASLFKNNDLILSNPDIFHYVMHQFYTYPEDAPDRYAAQLAQKIKQLTFDEFHIFDAPQIVSVLNALLFIHEISTNVRPHKFLFLSATPGELLLEYLDRSGLKVAEIRGAYASSAERSDQWRRILNQAVINFEAEGRAEVWVERHLQDILLPHFLERKPEVKGALIVNSVASAHRIWKYVRPVFEKHGLSVGLNTGLTSKSRRKASYDTDLLIGTSTVDVGVDFQINFLIFESLDGGSFLQRLGRLGRHDGFSQRGEFHRFRDFVAYAMVPNWIAERLFAGTGNAKGLFQRGDTLDRIQFNQAVQAAFPPPATFDNYARCWGQFQSIKILWGLGRAPVREQYRETRESLLKRYEQTFDLRFAIHRYKELLADRSPLLIDALSFRGGEEFPCCVIDETEPQEQERFKNADLLQIVANYHLEYLEPKVFFTSAEKVGLKRPIFEGRRPLGFFRLRGVREDRQNVRFFLDKDLLGWGAEKFDRADAVQGFRLDATFPGYTEINSGLQMRELSALLISERHPMDVKRCLQLPLLFPLYEFTSRDGVNGTVAFGRTALMLDSRLKYHPLYTGGGAVIV